MARAELFTIQTEKGASLADSLVRIDEQLRITYKGAGKLLAAESLTRPNPNGPIPATVLENASR